MYLIKLKSDQRINKYIRGNLNILCWMFQYIIRYDYVMFHDLKVVGLLPWKTDLKRG